MSRTITALFDTKADAEAGAERLRRAGVDAGHVNVHDQSTHATSGTGTTDRTDTTGTTTTGKTTNDQGLWGSIKNVFVPHEDRRTYEEGIRRGGFLLTADVDDDATPAAVKALEDANAIDLDERTAQWRSDGWDDSSAVATGYDDDTVYGSRETDVGGNRYRSYIPGRG